MTTLDLAQAILPQLIAWRRDIHSHPELGFEEVRTSAQVAKALEDMGLEVQTGIAKTGVVAKLGTGSPVIGLRADMDALPIQEAADVPYASQNPGVMHACGHDGNTTILLGVAKLLSEMDDLPSGELRFFFQPCEERQDDEGQSGASRLIAEGALEGVDAIVAQHVSSGTPVGKIELASGYAMAAADSFEATIIGKGAHGAQPDSSVDPIYILGHVIMAVNAIVSRRINPTQPGVVTIGSVHGGSAGNIIPERIKINGTLRSYDAKVREQLYDELDKALAVSKALGGDYELNILKGYPSTYNNPEVADLVREVAIDLAGEDAVKAGEPSMGAEDFSLMSQLAPAAMFMTGCQIDDGIKRPHHNEVFDLDEEGLVLGVAVMAEAVRRLLKSKAE